MSRQWCAFSQRRLSCWECDRGDGHHAGYRDVTETGARVSCASCRCCRLKGKRAEGPNRDSDGRDSHDQEITTSSVPKGLDGGRWYQAPRLEMLHKRRGQHVTIHPAWVGMMARLSAPSQYACRIPKAQTVPSR